MSSSIETPVRITPEEVVSQLRALREQIPDFTLQTPSASRPLVRAAAVGVNLIHESINAIAASPNLRNALGRGAAELRDEQDLIGRWSQVVVEIDSFRSGVVGSIRLRRHRLGGTALRAYKLSIHLTRYSENPVLLPHIEAMRRAVKAATRRPAPQPEPEPEPRPEPLTR